ncbi:MAG: potassium-transporting ATPase subunit KdpA [candidate division Zixibacteria bacterium]|nr:potassium-transporting ATPase subunit KdpA [candidate division Zixibacteria bacterium]
MNTHDYLQVALYVVALIVLTPILGGFMARVLQGERHLLSRPLGWLERGIYRLTGVDQSEESHWKTYAWALLAFNFFGFLAVFLLQMLQQWLPLNPQHFPAVSWHSSFNTAVSFMTNTNWQGYAGETTLSYLTQMLGLTAQNFVSAATAICVLLALVRGFTRRTAHTVGNFWADLVRSTVYILLPLSIVLTTALVSEGVVQTNSSYETVTTLEGREQTIPLGPAASQIAIKQLGTNGGGFFNANSAHPLENPTPLSNFLEMLAILLLPATLTYTYGKMIGNRKHGWLIFGVMLLFWIGGLTASLYAEYSHNEVTGTTVNMEGKEVRFGVTNSVIWSTATTCASNGSVNAMHSSLTPLAGGVAMFNIMLGEIVFGGVGCGLYGMVLFIMLTVFLAGLMVGRTPEYLGKKIEARDIQMVIVAIVAPGAALLVLAGISAVVTPGLSGLANAGPHGLSEILYAFASGVGNNGSAFAGLNANTVYYNVLMALAMLIGRFTVLLPVLAIAGYMGAKKISPTSAGTFSTNSGIFAILLVGVILIVGALTFFPALLLGPGVEHFLMNAGQSF